MKKNQNRFLQSIVFLFNASLVVQPVMAQIVTDANAPSDMQADVIVTQQGTPIVNIAAPSNSGLSHNHFDSFSVDENNAILNNSQQAVDTLVGGQIDANPNLNNGTASIILNEVTGTDRSLLEGYTEIAGDQAEVIIANPNGITCDGCGFINTPRAVLSTGTPQVNNGQLMSLSVNQGDIRIEGEGVNTGNIDQFDLITRSANINAEVLAKNLNIITGRNDVDIDSLEAIPKADDGSAKPQVSIDSSLLGGMFANTIRLVGTEQGVGVNLDGEMATNVGDISLSADGSITVNRVIAEQAVSIESANSQVTIDELTYGSDIEINAATDINNNGTVSAKNSITLNAQTINNQGDMIAGLNTDNTLNAGADLIAASETLNNNGQVIATNNVQVIASTVNNQNNIIEAVAGNVELDQIENLNNDNGNIVASTNIELTIDSLEQGFEQGLQANNNLIVNTERFDNTTDTTINSGLTLNLDEAFSNAGSLSIVGDLTINADSANNVESGTITTNASSNMLLVNDFQNQGVFTAATGLSITANNITNNNVLASGDALTLNATESISNIAVSANGDAITIGNIADTNTPLLFSVGDMTLYSSDFINRYAELYTLGNLSIAKNATGDASSRVLNSSSLIESAGNISIVTEEFTNKREVIGSFYEDFVNDLLYDNSDLAAVIENPCVFDYFDSCITVVGSDEFGISSGQQVLPWLATPQYDGDDYISVEEAVENLEALALAALKTPQVISGNNIDISAGFFTNQAGVVSAANNLTINANDVINQTIVAETPSYGLPVNGIPYVGNNSNFYFLDGTRDSSAPSIIDAYLGDGGKGGSLLGNPSVSTTPIALGIADIGRNRNKSPVFIYPNGNILVSTELSETPGVLSVDDNGELYVTGEDNETTPIQLGNLGEGENTYIDTYADGSYVLTLNGEDYPIVINENNALEVQFDSDNLPIQLTIANFLSGYTTTAQSSITFNPFDLPVQSPDYDTTFLPAQLQAGNNLTINATNTINNGVSGQGAFAPSTPPSVTIPMAPVVPSTVTTTLPSVTNNNGNTFAELANAIPPASDFVQVTVDTTVPTSGGIFTESDSDQFLVATNASVANFIDVQGTELLLAELNYQPDDFTKRLGDGFYESYLVREAIMAQTGRRFLHSSLNSDQQQFNYLMRNAIAAQQSLDLSLGVRLDQQQVAALTHDIVWLEESIVNGQKVLVPTLYLATVRNDDVLGSGQMVARNITLNANILNNTAAIKADNNLSVKTIGNIRNKSTVQAGNLLSLESDKDIINEGTIKANNNLRLAARRDIINETDKTITAKNNALINAGRDITLNASTINIGGDALIEAENNINLNAKQSTQQQWRKTTTTHQGSRIDVGGDLALASGGDTNLRASTIDAQGNLLIQTGKDLNVEAVENITEETRYQSSRELKDEQWKSSRSSRRDIAARQTEKSIKITTVTQQSSAITSGKDLSIDTKGDINLIASRIDAGNSADINADGALNVVNKKDTTTVETDTTVRTQKTTLLTNTYQQQIDPYARPKVVIRNGFDTAVVYPATRTVTQSAQFSKSDVSRSSSLNSTIDQVVASSISAGTNSTPPNNIAPKLPEGLLINPEGGYMDEQGNTVFIKVAAQAPVSPRINQGDLSITTGESLVLNNINLTSTGNLSLSSAKDISIGTTSETVYSGSSKNRRETVTHSGSTLTSAGDTQLTAENDLTIKGSKINAGGDIVLNAKGDTVIAAEQDSVYTYYEKTKKKSFGRKKKTIIETFRTTNVESDLNAGGNITLNSQINSDGSVATRDSGAVIIEGSTLTAKNQVAIAGDGVDVVDKKEVDFYRKETYKRGALGLSKTKTKRINRDEIVRSSDVTAEEQNLDLISADNLTITGSNVVAGGDTTLQAAGDVTIESAEQDSEYLYKKEKSRVGFFSGGGLSISLGKQSSKLDQATRTTQQVSSTVGSVNGDVAIKAGGNVTIAASDVLTTDGDIAIEGDNVNLTAKDNVNTFDQTFKQKSSGVTLALSGGVADTINTIDSSTRRIDSTDNKTLQALHAAKTTRALGDLSEGVDNLNNIGNDLKDVTQPTKGSSSNINLSVSLGSSSSKQTINTRDSQALGSSVSAGGDVSITANGSDDGEGDIVSQGTDIRGNNVTLNAANDLLLASAENTSTNKQTSKSSSAGVGVSLGSSGLQVFVEGSSSKGITNQSGDQYLETQITANNTASINSGGDTTLEGAQVSANSIDVDVGNNLTVISQQDQSQYQQENSSAGGKIGVGIGPQSPVSVSLNASELEANANYQAVQEQSGFFAGEGGVDIQVENNTDLQGGAILSEAAPVDNVISTNTLTTSNIDNVSEYDIESSSLSVGIGANGDGLTPQGIGGGHSEDSDSTNNTTTSVVSEGTIDIRSGDETALANIKTDEAEAHQVLGNIFDVDKIKEVEEEVEITQIASQEGTKAIGDYATRQLEHANELRLQAQGASPEERDRLLAEANAIDNNWKEGGTLRVAAHTVIGGLGGGIDGALGSLATSAAVPHVEAILKEAGVSEGARDVILVAASTGVGYQAGGANGAFLTTGQTINNYLSHKDQTEYAKELTACLNDPPCSDSDINDINKKYQGISDDRNEELIAAKDRCDNGDCQKYNSLVKDAVAYGYAAFAPNPQDFSDPYAHAFASDFIERDEEAVEQQFNELIDRTLNEEVVFTAPIDQSDPFNPNAGESEPKFISSITAQNTETAVTTVVVASAALLPGPEDLVLGALVMTKTGQLIGRVVEEGGKKFVRRLDVPEEIATPSSGAENIATIPKLQDQLRQQNLDNIAKADDRLAQAVRGSGSTNPNFGIGGASADEANRLGQIWVGDGHRLASDGKTLISADGTRRYRPPSTKRTISEYNPDGDKLQANFETLDGAKIISNGHLDIE